MARLLMIFARPGATELDGGEISALESHLAECPNCREHSRQGRRDDDSIARAMRAVVVPVRLQAELASQLARTSRFSLMRKIAILTLAGGVLLVGWRLWPAPVFDADAIAASAYDEVANRDGVVEWLARQNPLFSFPPRFNGKFLVACERRTIHGVTAPVLTFVRRDSLARVAVVTENQFRNLAEVATGRAAENSVSTIVVLRMAESPGVVYLVEVLNGPIEPFYNDEEISAT
ncbi:MAG: zf-HC2 domain-containing protein [Gemmataceae bacterium]|nr:zf-HC2 domain-containing protein [Gemmataceae bacterium]